jgi:2-polyprenyl-3-methyl-5-hydroxy-6-metoxy-1,4-benzoquinol methylase
VDADEAAQHFIRREVNEEKYQRLREEIVRLWGKTKCDVVQCDECSFVFAYPYVAGKETFYGLFLDSPSYPRNRFEFGQTAESIKQGRCQSNGTDQEGGKLLEIGAGDGAFLKYIVPDVFDKQSVACTEFSESGVQAIRRLGVECLLKDIRELARTGSWKDFSVICLFQVLEHMDDLDTLWEAFGRLTRLGADLYLSVPNGKWIEFQETRLGLLDMPPNHVGRWNRTAFAEMGRRYGWELVEYAVEPINRMGLLTHCATGRFFHARHQRGSLTDRMTRIGNRTLRRLCSLPVLMAWYLWAIAPALSVPVAEMGGTQWAHLRKTAS